MGPQFRPKEVMGNKRWECEQEDLRMPWSLVWTTG